MKKHLVKALSLFMVFAMLLGSVAMLVTNARAYSYIAYGIDVSAWQGTIDWTKVKASGIDFAILRIMASGKDKCFEANYTNGKAAGVKLGVYVYSYADTVAEAQAEAAKVLSYLNGRALEYPVYYDIEDARQSVLTKAQRTELCIAFCDAIEAAGYRAGIYSGTYWFNNYLDRATLTARYEIWEAMWPTSGGVQVKEPIHDKSSTCGMWQYTSEGSIPGISGYVDRNVSYKDYASYMKANGYNGYGNGTVTPSTPSVYTKNSYYQTTATVNFRTGPSTSDSVITALATGTPVSVTAFNADNTWAYASYNGVAGWISTTYLTYIRPFAYGLHYLTNNSTAMASTSFQHGGSVQVGTPSADTEGAVLKGIQLLRLSDFAWYTGSGWSANQQDTKLFFPGDTIIFGSDMTNPLVGDDNFYLCVVWGTSESSPPSAPETPTAPVYPTTPSNTSPKKWGWIWPANEAYGFMGNYGANGQDIELSVDLALLPSSDGKTSFATFYTDYTEKKMIVTPTSVTVGNTSVSYNWGSVSLSNWHNVKFKVYNGTGYVFIDGVLIASDSGFTANTDYQLLFSSEGQMAIDNAILTSSTGTTYFSCDFEDQAEAAKLMGSGLGHRELLFPDTSPFSVNIYAPETSVLGAGSVTFTATPTAGEGHSYSWYSSNADLGSFMDKDGDTLTIDIPYDLGVSIFSTITCKVESDGGVTSEASVNFTYTPYPAVETDPPADPEEIVTPISSEPAWDMSTGLYDMFDLGATYVWSNNALAYSPNGDTTRLTVTETSADPYTTLDVHNVHAQRIESNYLLITYTLPVGSDIRYFETYFSSSDDPEGTNIYHSDAARIFSEELIADGKKHSVVLDLTAIHGTAPFDATYLSLLRIDLLGAYNGWDYNPISAGSYIDVESVAFCGTHYEACLYANQKGLSAFPVQYEMYFVYGYDEAGTPLFDTVSMAGSFSNHILNPTVDIFPEPSQMKDGYIFAGWSYVISNNITLEASYGTLPAGMTTLTINGAAADALLATGKNEYSQTMYCRFDPIWILPDPVISAITPESASVTGTGSATYVAAATGEGLTYQWSSSNAFLTNYMTGADTASMTVNITEDIEIPFNATVICTVTDVNGTTATATSNFSYAPAPAPAISSVTPESASIEDTGIVQFTAVATGDGLTYEWTVSDPALDKYLSGADTDTLTVNVPEKLTKNISATLTLTVTNSYGKTASSTVRLEYTFTPEDDTDLDYLLGDLNGDGYITAADINILKRVVGGSANISGNALLAADVDRDGSITAFDSNILTRYVAGVITKF